MALSEAEVHWRAFLDNLIERGLRGVKYIASDDHAGLKAARKAMFPGVPWQRCQFHLQHNAHHCWRGKHAVAHVSYAKLRATQPSGSRPI